MDAFGEVVADVFIEHEAVGVIPERLGPGSSLSVGSAAYDRSMRVVDVDPWRIMIPGTVRERTRGLLGRDDLGQHEALLLTRCRSVHTFGMRFAIDVVLLDRGMRPVGLVEMRPGRVLLPRLRVRHLLEVAAGRGGAAAHEIHPPAPGTGSVAAESPRPRRPS